MAIRSNCSESTPLINLRTLIEHLQNLVCHPSVVDAFEEGEPLSQLLMNSHSPVVLSATREHSDRSRLLLADLVAVADPGAVAIRRKTRVRKVLPRDQAEMFDSAEETVSRFEVQQILEARGR